MRQSLFHCVLLAASCFGMVWFSPAQAAADPETAPAVGWNLVYAGSLTPVRSGETETKRFQVRLLIVEQSPSGQRTIAYLVQEQNKGQWLWPEQFGTMRLNERFERVDAKLGAAVLYELDGHPSPVKLPTPLFAHVEELKPGGKFTAGKDRFEVIAARKMRERDCWHVEVSTDFGWKQILWVEQGSPLIVGVDERVFLTGGQEFRLSLRLEELEPLSDEQLAKQRVALDALLALKEGLERPDGTTVDTLTGAQLARSREALKQLKDRAAETVFADLVADIERDVTRQVQRDGDLEELIQGRMGQPVPEFELATLGRKGVSHKDLKGKITVLHFWDYRGEPFVEPYGQVGYLDFLQGKRRKEGVQVYGVAVSRQLGQPQERREALRKIRKLRQFMNLSYPIALDSGKVLRDFGDPRQLGGKLPLYVVVDADGKVAHYHVGFYEIKADEGLRALDNVIEEVKKRQSESRSEGGA
jgi:peroxiredoxin